MPTTCVICDIDPALGEVPAVAVARIRLHTGEHVEWPLCQGDVDYAKNEGDLLRIVTELVES